jgi:outer membrane protein TolC
VARAGELASAAGQAARSSRVEVAYAAGLAYIAVLRAESVLAVRRKTVEERETLMRQAQAFFDTGLKARIDLVRAEANLYQARADVSSSEHELHNARLELLNRMGVDGPADFELVGLPSVIEAAGTVEDWRREAEENHPDLKALRLQVAAAQSAQLAAVRGDNPSIVANGRLGWAGEDAPTDRAWSVGAQLNVPVFNGRLTARQVDEAAANLAAVEFAVADRRRQILLLVEQADQAMRDADQRLVASEKQREAFAENLRLATGRYEAGAGDIIEMIDAQVQMANAETDLVQTRFDRVIALATLYRALGKFPGSGR